MIKTLPSSPLAPSAAANTLQSDANALAHAEATAEEAAAFMGALASVLSTLGPEAPKQGIDEGTTLASGTSSIETPNAHRTTSLPGTAAQNAEAEQSAMIGLNAEPGLLTKSGLFTENEQLAESGLLMENSGEGDALSTPATLGIRPASPLGAQAQPLLSGNAATTEPPIASSVADTPNLANVLQNEGPNTTSVDLANAGLLPNADTAPGQLPTRSATEIPQRPTATPGNLRANGAFGPLDTTEGAQALREAPIQSFGDPQEVTNGPSSAMSHPGEDGLGSHNVRNNARNDGAPDAGVAIAQNGVEGAGIAESERAQAVQSHPFSKVSSHTADAQATAHRIAPQEQPTDSAPSPLDDSTSLIETEDASGEKTPAHHLSSHDVAPEKAAPTNDAPRVASLEGRDGGAADLPAQESTVAEGTHTEHSAQDKVATESTTQTNRESRDQQLLRRMQQAFPSADVRIRTDAQGLTQVSLDHPSLGAVDLQLQFSGAGMDVAARVQSGVAAALLRRSEGSLRRRVGRQGIALRSMRISGNARRSPNANHPIANNGRSRAIDLEA